MMISKWVSSFLLLLLLLTKRLTRHLIQKQQGHVTHTKKTTSQPDKTCHMAHQQSTGYTIQIQDSLANAKVSMWQPWYIGHNSLNCPSPRNAKQHQRNLYIAVVASQKCKVVQNSEKILTYSSSRSSKVDDFGTNWKCICDYLLVINSNFGQLNTD